MNVVEPPAPGNEKPGATDKIWFVHVLRGFAALLVVFCHLGVAFWTNNAALGRLTGTGALASISFPPTVAAGVSLAGWGLDTGPLGVALFFLVSGFVIPISLERHSPGRFLLNRAFRLYPTYAVGLGIVCAAVLAYARSHGLPHHLGWRDFAKHVSLFRDWFGGREIDGVSWTLETEAKFYLLCAVIAAWANLRRAGAILAATGGLVVFVWLTAAVGVSAWPRVPGFGALHRVVDASAPYLIFMFVGTCFYNHHRGHWGWKRAAVVGAILLAFCSTAVAASPTQGVFAFIWRNYALAVALFAAAYLCRARVPRLAVFDWAARISYPLYVVHAVPGYVLLTLLSENGARPLPALLLTVPLLFSVAWLLHVSVEEPFVGLGKRLARHRLFAGDAGTRGPDGTRDGERARAA